MGSRGFRAEFGVRQGRGGRWEGKGMDEDFRDGTLSRCVDFHGRGIGEWLGIHGVFEICFFLSALLFFGFSYLVIVVHRSLY